MNTVLVLNGMMPAAISVGWTMVGELAASVEQLVPVSFFDVNLSGQHPYVLVAHVFGRGAGYCEQFEPIVSDLHVVPVAHIP